MSLNHRDIPSGFVQVLVSGISLKPKAFLALFYFISVIIMLWVFILSPRVGLFVIKIYALCLGALSGFCL